MILELYLARDKDGSLWMHTEKPRKVEDGFESDCCFFVEDICEKFEGVTIENSPIKFTGFRETLWQSCLHCTFGAVDNLDGRVICTKLARELYPEEMCPLLKSYYDNIYVGE
jgi:hypothetical protein